METALDFVSAAPVDTAEDPVLVALCTAVRDTAALATVADTVVVDTVQDMRPGMAAADTMATGTVLPGMASRGVEDAATD